MPYNSLLYDGVYQSDNLRTQMFETAYQEAKKHFIKDGNNHIILFGNPFWPDSSYESSLLSDFITKTKENGISFSLFSYSYLWSEEYRINYYITKSEELAHVILEKIRSPRIKNLDNINFKLDFNPEKVKGYHLIGYEVPKTRFYYPFDVDAGTLAYNQQITVLYEIVPADSNIEVEKAVANYHTTEPIPSDAIAMLSARYTENGDTIREIKKPIASQLNSQMSENIQFAAAVAEIGMILNNSELKGTSTYESAYQLLSPLHSVKLDPTRAEFFKMVRDMPNLMSLTEKETIERQEREQQQKELEQRQKEQEEIRAQQIANFGGIPTVKPKKPEVTGALDKRIIQKIVRQHTAELRTCYEKQAQRIKGLYGRVEPMWIISAKGDVTKVVIKESTLKNKEVEKCITNTIKQWKFPNPKNGGLVQVSYSFDFELSNK